jgi:hypothetical protein
MRVADLEFHNAHHPWDIRQQTFDDAPIKARKALLAAKKRLECFPQKMRLRV